MAKLKQADRAIAALDQLDGKIAQDPVRILVLLIDQSREVALGVEHGISHYFSIASRDRGGGCVSLYVEKYHVSG